MQISRGLSPPQELWLIGLLTKLGNLEIIRNINMHWTFESNFERKSMLLCSNKIKGVNGSLLLFIDSNFFLGTMCAQIFYCSFQLPLVFHDHEKIHISCLTECLFRQVFYDSFCDNEYKNNTGTGISSSYFHINLYFS